MSWEFIDINIREINLDDLSASKFKNLEYKYVNTETLPIILLLEMNLNAQQL